MADQIRELEEALERVDSEIDNATDLYSLLGFFAARANVRAQLANLSGEIRWLAR